MLSWTMNGLRYVDGRARATVAPASQHCGRRRIEQPPTFLYSGHGRLEHSRVRILFSYGVPIGTTNPYLKQLAAAVESQAGVTVVYFTGRHALTARYDLFHV